MIEQPRKVVVEGIISAGKSTVAEALAQYLGYEFYSEAVDPELLAKFYEDQAAWGFALQLFLLGERYAAEKSANSTILAGRSKGVVEDRWVGGDVVFAQLNKDLGNIDPWEFKIYYRLYQLMVDQALYPDVMVFLDVPIDLAMERIQARLEQDPDRSSEALIPRDYMVELKKYYEGYIKEVSTFCPVVRLDNDGAPLETAYVWACVKEAWRAAKHGRRFVTSY